ncbi:toxic anion resistance protein [uncultured Abiotrophia sp.]|uniref:toxic anion resistance protein n=1 Tax=uncultured Abiotrophia sp. TaxID=316094 RepID=UPI00260B0DB5|nr:toxic anion resistance protein [uncultured Abiotrophia sp.]
MSQRPDLFEEMQAHTPKTSTVEDLLDNPFDLEEAPSPASPHNDLVDAEMMAKRAVTTEKLIDRLPEHRQQQAYDLAKQIDEQNMSAVIAYGSNAQKKLSEFSHGMLNKVQLKDTGEIADVLTDLMHQLESSNPRDLTASPNIFQKFFGKIKASIAETQARYQKIGTAIDRVAIRLEREKNELLNDNLMLEQLYQKNKDYFEALNIYIAAGELKMQELQEEIIPAAIEKAKASGDQMDVQTVNDLNQFLDRLDKRTHDLRLTRQMTVQQAPQIRMIQNTNQALAEKIQVSVHTAIPLWENQVMIALTLLRQQNAAVSQRQVSQTTNDLLKRNADMLKQSAIDTARESERGVIDIETLQHTQNSLIETIEQTLEIQREGRRQRQIAEQELQLMEGQLRDKLMAISNEQQAYLEE